MGDTTMINFELFKKLGYTEKTKIEDIQKSYNDLGLKWGLDGMLFINDNNITITEIYNGEDFRALLVLIQAGIKSHNIEEAKAVFDKWSELGYGFRTLRCLCIDQLENKEHFFLGEVEQTTILKLQEENVGANYIMMEMLARTNMELSLREKGKYLIQ